MLRSLVRRSLIPVAGGYFLYHNTLRHPAFAASAATDSLIASDIKQTTTVADSKLSATDPRVKAVYSPESLTSNDVTRVLSEVKILLDEGHAMSVKTPLDDVAKQIKFMQHVIPWMRAMIGYQHWIYPVTPEAGTQKPLLFPSGTKGEGPGVIFSLFTDEQKMNLIKQHNPTAVPQRFEGGIPAILKWLRPKTVSSTEQLNNPFIQSSALTGFSYNPGGMDPYMVINWSVVTQTTTNWFDQLQWISNQYCFERWLLKPRETITGFSPDHSIRLLTGNEITDWQKQNNCYLPITSADHWPSSLQDAYDRARNNKPDTDPIAHPFIIVSVGEFLDGVIKTPNAEIVWNADTTFKPPKDTPVQSPIVPLRVYWNRSTVEAAHKRLKDYQQSS